MSFEQFRSTRFQTIFILGCIVAFIIWGLIYRRKADLALRNGALVNATIVNIFPSRSSTDIFVTYNYDHKQYAGKFPITSGDYKRGMHVLIKVARENPGEYILFIRKID